MKLRDCVNGNIHRLMLHRLFASYRKEMSWIRKEAPESFADVPSNVCNRHLALWRSLDPDVTSDWLRLLTAIGGGADYRYIPSTAYYGVVERCLNNCNMAGGGVEDKNLMSFYVPAENRAHCILRYVRGVFFDDDFNALNATQADEFLKRWQSDVVGKVAVDSSGGHSVELFRNVEGGRKCGRHELCSRWIMENVSTYVVQERLKQEPVIARFNPASINTCRIVTFRRPWDGVVRVAASMLRLGCSSDIVDNISSGGVSVGVLPNGILRDKGLDAKFHLQDRHPRTGLPFAGVIVPGFDSMCKLACKIAARVPDFNILGFDMMVREDGRPCVVEINGTSLCCIEVQMSGPFFGEDTDVLVEWCKDNARLDAFKHIRTWY